MPDPWYIHTPGCGRVKKAYVPILAPEPGSPVSVYLLSNTIWERELHYDADIKRSVPCPRTSKCRYCRAWSGTRPTGYTPCAVHGTLALAILQLSDAALTLLDTLAVPGEVLRGLGVRTHRADLRRNSKMLLTIHPRIDDATLPPEFDPRPALEQMWGVASAKQIVGRTAGEIDDATRARRARKAR